MNKTFAILLVAVILFSCSEDEEPDRIVVPFAGDYKLISYTTESGGSKYPTADCANDLGNFSDELGEFSTGDLTINQFDTFCYSCGQFSGNFIWVSRCDKDIYAYTGIWSTRDVGATLSFVPESPSIATLQFSATLSSSGIWKLRYNKGDSFIVLNYERMRD